MDTNAAAMPTNVHIRPETLDDLRALAVLTREPEEVLLAAAVEALRAARLRTAQPRPSAPARTRKSAQ